LQASDWISATALYAAVFGITVACATMLAARADRRLVRQLTLWGLVAACAKIWLVQQAPQWHDTSPDSITYQLHAQALAAHWQGLPIDAKIHQLKGLLSFHDANGLGIWPANATLPYSAVLGTHEWLYAAYLAIWQLIASDWTAWATYSNGALAAFFPAAAFGIARCLGASARTAKFAATLALLDPSAAVNGAWLLKDTVAGWFALAAIWAAVRLIGQPHLQTVIIFAVAGGMLGAVRFAAFAAILVGVACVLPILLSKGRWAAVIHLAAATVAGLCIFSTVYALPVVSERPVVQDPLLVLGTILAAQERTLAATSDHPAADSTVVEWRSRFLDDPLKAVTTSVARTLFAPYPWVALTHGLDYKNGIELYYPGVLLWVVCLPGIAWALVLLMQKPVEEFLFTAAVICALLGAYVIFMGEWSTRQRVFMLPVFFAFAAMGWADLRIRWGRWRRAKINPSKAPE